MSIKFFGDWKKAVKLCMSAKGRFGRAADVALKRQAVRAQNLMRGNIDSAAPPQSPYTTATGGKGKPLQRDGDMKGAINVTRAGVLAYFIGVPKADGAYQIAVVQEEGRVIVQPLTERMRAYLIAKLSSLGPPPKGGGKKRVLVTQIPARPFIGPAVEQVQGEFSMRFRRDFAKALRGEYGT